MICSAIIGFSTVALLKDDSNIWFRGNLISYHENDDGRTTLIIKGLTNHSFPFDDIGGYNLDEFAGQEILISAYTDGGYTRINSIKHCS